MSAFYSYPITKIQVVELEQMFDVTLDSVTDTHKATVTLPANTSATDKIYTLEVFANNVATDVTCTVTVLGSPVSGVSANPALLPAAGGDTVVTVTFNTDP